MCNKINKLDKILKSRILSVSQILKKLIKITVLKIEK